MTAQSDIPRTAQNNAIGGFWRRTVAMLIKEFIQLKRDRVSFAMIIMIPLVQLILFGYAINTNPRNLPTAVLLQEQSDLGRSILRALENTRYFKVTHQVHDEAEFDQLLASGKVLFAIEIPAGFERAVRRGDRPAILVAADATDPVASGSALSALSTVLTSALQHDRIERGTLESLLSMPITPVEIMLGKIIPYILVGFIQASLIVGLGIGLFGVPVLGNLLLLAILSTLFITTNLSIGYTFSTLAQNQLQAMQMSLMFFLPNILLSGFMFPFAGMPVWAQWIGECLPLTHYLRIVRSILLKGSALPDLHYDTLALSGLMLLAMTIAVTRFRRTLD